MIAKRNRHKGTPVQIYLSRPQLRALDARVREAGSPWTRASIVRELIAIHIQQQQLKGIE